MPEQRHVKLFRNGRNQAVRIPREFELPGDEAVMRKEGDRLVIEAAVATGPNARLLAVLEALEPISAEDALPIVEDDPPGPVVI